MPLIFKELVVNKRHRAFLVLVDFDRFAEVSGPSNIYIVVGTTAN